MAFQLLHLTDLIPKERLEDILYKFHKVTKMSTLITDYQGRPITTTDYFIPLCKKIRMIPELCEQCKKCDAMSGLESSINKKPYMHQCHAGLIDVAIPIFVDNDYLGVIFTGQVLLNDKDMKKIKNHSNYSLNYSLYPDLHDEFVNYSKTTTKLSLEELEAYIDLLSLIANYVAELSYKILTENKLKDQEMRILETEKLVAEEKIINAESMQSLFARGQFNSKFLHETFNAIYQQAVIENAVKTKDLIYTFSSLLNENDQYINSLTTISVELEHIQNYLKISNLSHINKLEVKYEIDSETNNYKIPAMVLQTLIENVFIPSLEISEKDFIIVLKICIQSGKLKLKISSSNCDLPTMNTMELKKTEAFSSNFMKLSQMTLKNISDLLEFHFLDDYEFLINNDGNILITIPLI